MARLQEKYKSIKKELKKELNLKNSMDIPYLEKIVVNIGIGKAIQDQKVLEAAVKDLTMITGQKVVLRKSKKDISNFKLRKGMSIGVMVTLRAKMMYEFLDRLVNVAIPRIRDFHGVSRKAFDNAGNYNLGIKEHIIFPEIKFDSVYRMFGLNITFCINCKGKEHSLLLLEKMGMPFAKIKKVESVKEITEETKKINVIN